MVSDLIMMAVTAGGIRPSWDLRDCWERMREKARAISFTVKKDHMRLMLLFISMILAVEVLL